MLAGWRALASSRIAGAPGLQLDLCERFVGSPVASAVACSENPCWDELRATLELRASERELSLLHELAADL